MVEYRLAEGLRLYPTPAGAYHAVAGQADAAARRWLLRLMALEAAPPLCVETLVRLGESPPEAALRLFQRLQLSHLVQGVQAVFRVAGQSLATVLPPVLARLAGEHEGLLADDQGFCLAAHGLSQARAEELAGLAAELCRLRCRYADALAGDQRSAWAVVGAGGYSDLGFWPLRTGAQCFVLMLGGRPNLNQQATVELVWRLVHRYGAGERPADADAAPPPHPALSGHFQENAACVQKS